MFIHRIGIAVIVVCILAYIKTKGLSIDMSYAINLANTEIRYLIKC